MMSHRSGETEDTTIADLAVADRLRPDQDRRAGPLRPGRQVQPAAADRGGAGRRGALRRRGRVPAVPSCLQTSRAGREARTRARRDGDACSSGGRRAARVRCAQRSGRPGRGAGASPPAPGRRPETRAVRGESPGAARTTAGRRAARRVAPAPPSRPGRPAVRRPRRRRAPAPAPRSAPRAPQPRRLTGRATVLLHAADRARCWRTRIRSGSTSPSRPRSPGLERSPGRAARARSTTWPASGANGTTTST